MYSRFQNNSVQINGIKTSVEFVKHENDNIVLCLYEQPKMSDENLENGLLMLIIIKIN